MVLLILGEHDHVSGIEKDRVKLENMASTEIGIFLPHLFCYNRLGINS